MTFEYGTETYEQAFPDHRDSFTRPSIRGYISYGLKFHEACAKHPSETFRCSRVYILDSASLANNTFALAALKKALGAKVVGVKTGLTSHTMWSECVEITNECRSMAVDLIIKLGGGSLTDAGKLIVLALANDVTQSDDLKRLPANYGAEAGGTKRSVVPYTNYSGATEDSTKRKYQFGPPLVGPALVILDPELALMTPDKLWLSTGVRAVDHCVETLCSLTFNEKGDADASQGLRNLISGLLRCKTDQTDLDAHFLCQIGVKFAISAPCRQTQPAMGASHAIGHMMGPLGVGHGETSCIALPAVCKFNAAKGANLEPQRKVFDILWELKEIQGLGLDKEKADLGDVLDAFFRVLGMPRTLKAVGVAGDKVDLLAENTLHDDFCGDQSLPTQDQGGCDVPSFLDLKKSILILFVCMNNPTLSHTGELGTNTHER
ncbi:Dehydroquinate synthase-like protein [Dacryopinax primogenitus]|uniref:Dehydroquinate synthase-like protein n=1 Tax=Dacryopinax primogenitus (strain DJM 731) TaxID=1858805 RepID=M5FT32_DACPD|nr:Dehydroquinate synthase-like protein [Dacryopinax primogenitus]EJT99153.1 Dehydroquinate synthase-like protein [Dacryopinax primogenitus]